MILLPISNLEVVKRKWAYTLRRGRCHSPMVVSWSDGGKVGV